MKEKKIIFIGGTARSGSTLLDLILANDPKAMSLGEIHALFRPTRKHHFEEIEKLKNDSVWSRIIDDGKKKLYSNLIKYFPDIDIFVDSSKDPFWFRFHEKINAVNYDIKHVLVYKSPEELAKSYIKRGNPTGWYKTYVHYHKKYFSLIDNFRTIGYKDLIANEDELKNLCKDLGIDYFDSKRNYWEKKQNTFFGSNSVKSQKANRAKKQLQNYDRSDLTYDNPEQDIFDVVNEQIGNNKIITDIFDLLKEKYISKNTYRLPNHCSLKLFLIKQKHEFKRLYHYYIPENYFNT